MSKNTAFIEVGGDNFEEEVLKSPQPVLVDFYGEHCMPCKALAPILEKISEEFPGLKIVKFNCDLTASKRKIIQNYQIRSLPTMLFFKNELLVDRLHGFNGQTENQIKQIVRKMLQEN